MGSQNGSHCAPVTRDALEPLFRGPLTHYSYCIYLARQGKALGGFVKPFVQVKRRGAVVCGQVKQLAEFTEGEWFQVETKIGDLWAQGHNVRLCSGDGRCDCDSSGFTLDCAAGGDRGFSQAGVVAPPDGSIGGTLPNARLVDCGDCRWGGCADGRCARRSL